MNKIIFFNIFEQYNDNNNNKKTSVISNTIKVSQKLR